MNKKVQIFLKRGWNLLLKKKKLNLKDNEAFLNFTKIKIGKHPMAMTLKRYINRE